MRLDQVAHVLSDIVLKTTCTRNNDGDAARQRLCSGETEAFSARGTNVTIHGTVQLGHLLIRKYTRDHKDPGVIVGETGSFLDALELPKDGLDVPGLVHVGFEDQRRFLIRMELGEIGQD